MVGLVAQGLDRGDREQIEYMLQGVSGGEERHDVHRERPSTMCDRLAGPSTRGIFWNRSGGCSPGPAWCLMGNTTVEFGGADAILNHRQDGPVPVARSVSRSRASTLGGMDMA